MCEQSVKRGMGIAGRALRSISLAILFGGSASVVFAAVTLVNAAKGQGIAVSEAARANAPVFIHFSTVAIVAGLVLLCGEWFDFSSKPRPTRLAVVRYASSILCALTTMIFAFLIVPPMSELSQLMKTDHHAYESFKQLHQISRGVFGGTILLALISLLLPAFEGDAGVGSDNRIAGGE